ncbi:unnamed protein product [Brugia pahangi]|uniref:Ovule protein n=1 Tax=Brugia pahangi TaxID=6280 RepID=A0A0N4TMP7_BRUPA|nr:unnamed protein product [Brugia pahangi]
MKTQASTKILGCSEDTLPFLLLLRKCSPLFSLYEEKPPNGRNGRSRKEDEGKTAVTETEHYFSSTVRRKRKHFNKSHHFEVLFSPQNKNLLHK